MGAASCDDWLPTAPKWSICSLADVASCENHVFVLGNIGDFAFVTQLLDTHHPAAIVNFAAESHVDRSIDGPRDFVQTNFVGNFELLMAARSYWEDLPQPQRDQFASYMCLRTRFMDRQDRRAASPKQPPTHPTRPIRRRRRRPIILFEPYHTYGLPVLTTNCSNNYGPYQFLEKLIPLMILNAVEGKSLPVYGDGKNVRDWLYVEDHCRAIRLVMEMEPSAKSTTLAETANERISPSSRKYVEASTRHDPICRTHPVTP